MFNLSRIPPSEQLQPLNLVAPGFRGLNLSQSSAVMSPAYALEAQNAVIDEVGRLAARDGFQNFTVTPIAAAIKTIFEYRMIDGTASTVISYDGGISTDIVDPASAEIQGTITATDGNWWFQNFNNKLLAFQAGQKLAVYNGAGTFATVTEVDGTAPTGGVALAAYGRVWQLDSDLQTIKYSGLLDETLWASSGAGTIDMRNIWTDGMDQVTAIWAWNGSLVVFGKRHIVFWDDGQGSVLGIDPTNLVVADIITGTGCVSQHTIQAVGQTDLLFLSPNGVQSLKRLIVERSRPISNLSKLVRDELVRQLQTEDVTALRSTYNPLTGFYALSFPENATVWIFDQRRRYQDEDGDELSIVTRWAATLTALHTSQDNETLVARTTGKVAKYMGDDDEGTYFRFKYESPWLDLGTELGNRLKILKRIGAILFIRNPTTVIVKYWKDFETAFGTVQTTVQGDGGSEYGIAEYGIAEYSGVLALRVLKLAARATGQYLRIGIEADVQGEFSMQQASLFTKIGRVT